VWIKPAKIGCRGNVPRGIENYFQTDHLQLCSSTVPENLAKIGPKDFEIIGLTEIVEKIKDETEAEQ